MATMPTQLEMPSGTTVTPTLLSELRARTQTSHRELERTPLLSGLLAADLSLHRYRQVLEVFTHFYREVDACFATQTLDSELFADYTYQPRSAPLRADLASLNSILVAQHPDAIQPAGWRAEFQRACQKQQQAWLLGMAYVVEGSSQGASIIAPKVARSLSLKPDHGLQFFTQQGRSAPSWQRLRAQLSRSDIGATDAQRAQACGAAHRMFTELQYLASKALKPSQVR